MKRETAVLKNGDSMMHGGNNGGMEDRQRLFLFDSIAQTWFLIALF
jgi:hypothetical protein